MAMMADGSIGTCQANEIVLNIECQKLCNFEQDQNRCKRAAGSSPHLSQVGSMLGLNFASLTLDQ